MFVQNTEGRWRRLACATALIMLAACHRDLPEKPPAPAPQVTVITVRRASVPVTVELPGRTSAYLVAQVRARVDGIVQQRNYQEGADVKANQLLYRIDPAPYRNALNSALASQQKAEANLASTSAQASRYRVLLASNAVSRQDYDNALAAQRQAAADVAVAKAAVATARLNLGYTTVLAPISGRSGASQVTQGAYVQAGPATLLTTIQQIDPIYVDLSQASVDGLQLRSEAASGRLKPTGPDQARVTLTLEDGSQYPVPGTLQFSGATVDPATGSLTVRALFPNPRFVLLPGMFVRARFEQGVNDQALLVPIAAINRSATGQATALVVGPDNKLVRRPVQTRNMLGDQWVVTGGLNEGERVVVSGLQKVQPGMQVRAVEARPTPAPGSVASNAP